MSVGASELLVEPEASRRHRRARRPEVTARSPRQLFWRRFRSDRVAMASAIFIILLIVVAIAAPLVVKILGVPGPNINDPNATDAFGSPPGPTGGASVRRRPARPRRALAHDLRRARVAGGRDHRDRDRGRGRHRRRAPGRLLPRLGRHRRLAHRRRVPGLPGARARPRHRRRLRRARLRRRPDPARARHGDLHHRDQLASPTSRGSCAARCCRCARRSSSRPRARSARRTGRILFREILPNLVAPLIVYSSLLIPTNILLEAALSFLGVGIRPPTAAGGR